MMCSITHHRLAARPPAGARHTPRGGMHRARLFPVRAGGRAAKALLALMVVVLSATAAHARTITLTGDDSDQMAIISAKVPRASWAAMLAAAKVYNTESQVHFYNDMAILIRFPLTAIPKGQRITKAELTIASDYVAGKPEIQVRRMLAEWGTGVCHQYRLTHPKKIEWAQPGGRGAATDRAAKPTAVFRFEKASEQTVDVTEDVELWYTGAAANRGWILTEETAGAAYLAAPYSPHHNNGKRWKLQITYEPQ